MSAVALASCVVAPLLFGVVLRAFVAAVNSPVVLHALVDAYYANAVAAGAFHSVIGDRH
jgi:hypothetical protein